MPLPRGVRLGRFSDGCHRRHVPGTVPRLPENQAAQGKSAAQDQLLHQVQASHPESDFRENSQQTFQLFVLMTSFVSRLSRKCLRDVPTLRLRDVLFCDGPGGKLPADVPTLRLGDVLCFVTVQKTLKRRSISSS